MHIYVDADACPVKEIIIEEAGIFGGFCDSRVKHCPLFNQSTPGTCACGLCRHRS